jgi:hypothetical protein
MTSTTVDTTGNSSFSTKLPGLQLATDSTSLGAYKTCPKLYYYSVICGWKAKSESVHLTFGLLLHKAREHYEHAKATGLSHDDALDKALDMALRLTWVKELKRAWISGDANKNRLTLIRTVIWYLDKYGEEDVLKTVVLASGKPAVELSFRFDAGYIYSSTGERVLFCGHFDRLAQWNDDFYVPDIKSTYHSIDASYFAKFSPDNQFSMYTLAGKVAFAVPAKGVVLDAVQVLVGGTRFQRALIARSESQVQEWLEDSYQLLAEMEHSALTGHWRQNDKACHNQYGRPCDFREVCTRPKEAREKWLQASYSKRTWDPLQRRGDI